jgi:hypothetical protein
MIGDVETVKRLTAKRTLELYNLTFDTILRKAPASNDNSEMPIARNSDEFFSLIFSLVGGAFGEKLSSDEIKKEAQAKAESRITFVNDRTARIEWPDGLMSLAVFEDGQWKIDDTEIVKKEILKFDLPTIKERIKRY